MKTAMGERFGTVRSRKSGDWGFSDRFGLEGLVFFFFFGERDGRMMGFEI